jgi:hypothetical protein
VYQVRSDTVYRMRTDTVTVSRIDTVTQQLPPVYPQVRMGGFYWGLGGGLSAPRQELNTVFEPGFNITGLLGWDPIGSPFGVRFDVAYDQFSERSQFAALGADPSLPALRCRDGRPGRALCDRRWQLLPVQEPAAGPVRVGSGRRHVRP